MRSVTLYAGLVALLFVSAVTLGVIDEGGTGTSAGASASASKGNYHEVYDEYLYWDVWTTEAGNFAWTLWADAYAYVDIQEFNGWCRVHVIGDAAAWCDHGEVPPVVAELNETQDGSYVDDPSSDSDGGVDWFGAYDNVSSRCFAAAEAEIEEGSDATCWGYATADTSITLSDE